MFHDKLRQRKGGAYQHAPISLEHHSCTPKKAGIGNDGGAPGGVGIISSAAYASAFLAFAVAGLLCAAFPPLPTSIVDNVKISSSAKCVRAARNADYTSIELNVGSPGRRVRVLVRFDRAVDSPKDALRLFESQVLESSSVHCSGITSNCTDAVLTTDATEYDGFGRTITSFHYTAEAVESSIAKSYLKLEGELYLVKGHEYWLTSSHLCFLENSQSIPSTATSSENELVGSVRSDSKLVAKDSDLAKTTILKASFAREVTVQFL